MRQSFLKLNKLSFIHIPKTAGLSLHAELEKYFGECKSLRIQNQEDRASFFSMSPAQLSNYDYITGHISVEELTRKDVHYPTISVLREPVRRLISLQHYLTISDHEEHQDIGYDNLERLLDDMFSKEEFNLQCWHLCGWPSFELAVESIKANSIFVVPLEYYQDLIETLSELLGTPLSNQRINVTQYKTSIDIEDLTHDLLDSIVGDDKKLFSYVKQNYESLKQEFLQSLVLR